MEHERKELLKMCEGKYDLILSDPAWKQSKGGKKNVRPKSSGEELTYTTITLEEIEQLQKQMRDKSNENHILFLWTIDKYLHESEAMPSFALYFNSQLLDRKAFQSPQLLL